MSTAASRRRLNDAIISLERLTRSPRLHAVHVERSGIALNAAAFRVLAAIVRDGPIDLTALADETHLAPNALSRQVKILESHRLIERRRAEGDARVSIVHATPEGTSQYRAMRQANDRLFAHALRSWTTTELDDLAARLEMLVADLRQPHADVEDT